MFYERQAGFFFPPLPTLKIFAVTDFQHFDYDVPCVMWFVFILLGGLF